jgi:methionyl-tRNA formyltransferase
VSRPRVVFMGTPEFAVPSLAAVAASCLVAAVVTRPDRPRGRGLESGPSAVALEAARLGLETLKPERVNAPELCGRLTALKPDLVAVVAFGAILGPDVLRVPRLGAINMHGSLLPDYRGASPVQRALWDGQSSSGVTTLWMDEGIDTGDLILQRWHPIDPGDDAATLARALAALGAPLLAESLALAHAGRAPRRPQPRSAGSYAGKLGKRDGEVDWTLDAATVWNHQRAVTPWPGATAHFQGRRLQVLAARPLDLLPRDDRPGTVLALTPEAVSVACGRGALALLRVKPEGRAEMGAAEWARGARVAPGVAFEPAGRETKEVRI